MVGFASTQLLVSEGVERFTGVERTAAEEALFEAKIGCLDNPIVRGLIPKLRVVEVKFAPERCATALSTPAQSYRVVLQAYTFFGIPVNTISFCGGIYCLR